MYTVTGIGANGCRASDTLKVDLDMRDKLFVPTAFSTNGDGKNDVFRVYGSTVKGADIRIYTQWGAQIYETNDNATGWDGKSKGLAQPVGMYIYVIKVRMQDEDTFIKKGTINLIR